MGSPDPQVSRMSSSDEEEVQFTPRDPKAALAGNQAKKYWDVDTTERNDEKKALIEKYQRNLNSLLEKYDVEEVLYETDKYKNSKNRHDRKTYEVAQHFKSTMNAVGMACKSLDIMQHQTVIEITLAMESVKKDRKLLPLISEDAGSGDGGWD